MANRKKKSASNRNIAPIPQFMGIGEQTSVELPVSYETLNIYNSIFNPSTVHCANTYLVNFFSRYLMQRAMSVFAEKIPDNWDKDYLWYSLLLGGYVAVINTKSFGVIPQDCTLSGYNVFYRPTDVLIANPLLNINKELRIGRDCELIRLTPDYRGIYDIITYIADNMSLTAEAAGVNIINSKLSFAFLTDDKVAAEAYKKAYDNYASGQPMVVMGGNDLFGADRVGDKFAFFNNDVAGSYVVDKLQNALRQWELMFDNYVGIPNSPVNKKERVVIAEISSNNVESRTLSDIWLEELTKSAEKCSKMFDIDLSFKYRHEVETELQSTVDKEKAGDEDVIQA